MDSNSNIAVNIQPCSSKSIKAELSRESSKTNQDQIFTDYVIIDDDDSLDSAYETASAVSRSTQSSPTIDVPKPTPKSPKIALPASKKELYFHANIHYEHNIIAPWPLCLRKCVNRAADSKHVNSVSNNSSSSSSSSINNDTIVISDSDDSDRDDENPPPSVIRNRKLNRTMSSSASPSNIIVLDSSDEDDETKPETVIYHTVEDPFGKIRKIPDYYMAYNIIPDPNVRLPNQLRVIARRKQEHLPITWAGRAIEYLYHSDDSAFYAGILSCEGMHRGGQWHYMVFFDDGHVQYVKSSNIRVVFGNYGKRYVHENAQKFYDYYFYRMKMRRLMEVQCKVDMTYMVFLNNRPELAKVADYEPDKRRALVLFHFLKTNHAEWLYIGSPRIERVWKLIHKDKQMQQYHQMNDTLIEVSSDSEAEDEFDLQSPQKKPLPVGAKDPKRRTIRLAPNELIDGYKETQRLDRQHTCGKRCVRDFEWNPKIFDFDPLKRPILAGWTRTTKGLCEYTAPCGRPFRTIETTYKYLITTGSKLTIDCFSFSCNIECMKEVISYNGTNSQYFLNDLIKGGNKEKRRIPVVPIADNLPTFREYVTKYRRNPQSKKVPLFLTDTTNNPFRSGCDCDDDCSNKSKCSCWQLTLSGSKQRGGYNFKRLDGRVATGIYECNPNCKCSSKCLNRVVSAQIEQKLELYETKDRGYGLRCQTDLPKGTFISCYFGDILHGKTADERAMKKSGSCYGDEYFMQLDYIEVAEHYKEGYESDVSDIEDSNAENSDGAPSKRFRFDDTLSVAAAATVAPMTNGSTNNVISYFPNILKKKAQVEENQRTNLYGVDAVEYVVDGRYRGNIARFFNHSCQPNLFSQTVFTDIHDLRFPWISFFASEDIKAGTELTWDYGYIAGSILGREMECRCGAEYCRKRLL